MGHKDVATTMIYTHLMNNSLATVRSRADTLAEVSGFGVVTNRAPE
jgi:site-specific recombinase XerC